ncbi:MAG: response regulator [Treponema sp.]|nr:response regulator [Treponema sp.]
MEKTIFIVDDNTTNLALAEEALENQYLVITLSSAAKMLTALEKIKPDLILLDIEMPDISGFEAIKYLKASDAYSEIPVIFLTGISDAETEATGIELGAVDFIAKPFSAPVLLNRIKYHLNIDELIHNRTDLLRIRTDQLVRLQNSIVFTLADLVENRDSNTGGHIERTTVYIKILIDAMVEHSVYVDEIHSWNLDSLISSARLHDLGKIAIPDIILNKPDKLTPEEFTIIKTHPVAGERIIDQMISRTGDEEFLHNAKLFVAYHHERWDGTGYPYGLKGAEIPLQGRIMAIVDIYDALTSQRPYKKAFSSEEAIGIIQKGSGTHFDPQIADIFCGIKDKLELARVRISS